MFEKKLDTLKKQVEYILESTPKTRDNDKLLAWTLWKQFYGDYFDENGKLEMDNFLNLPSQANIQRIRAKLQNTEYKYLPTTLEVAIKRKLNIERWRQILGYEDKLSDQGHTNTETQEGL